MEEKACKALTNYRVVEPSASIARLRRQLPYRNAAQPSSGRDCSSVGCRMTTLGSSRPIVSQRHLG